MRELVSALVDGEMSDADLELAFAALMAADGQQAWSDYHQLGDALRDPAAPALSDGFAARLAARLDAEAAYSPPPLQPARPEPQPEALSAGGCPRRGPSPEV